MKQSKYFLTVIVWGVAMGAVTVWGTEHPSDKNSGGTSGEQEKPTSELILDVMQVCEKQCEKGEKLIAKVDRAMKACARQLQRMSRDSDWLGAKRCFVRLYHKVDKFHAGLKRTYDDIREAVDAALIELSERIARLEESQGQSSKEGVSVDLRPILAQLGGIENKLQTLDSLETEIASLKDNFAALQTAVNELTPTLNNTSTAAQVQGVVNKVDQVQSGVTAISAQLAGSSSSSSNSIGSSSSNSIGGE